MSDLVVAIFHDRDQAFAAVDALVHDGVALDHIGFLAAGPERFGQLQRPGSVERSSQRTALRAGKGPLGQSDGTTSGRGRTSEGSAGGGLRDLRECEISEVGPMLAAGPMGHMLATSPSYPAPQAIVDMLVRRGIDTSQAREVLHDLRHGGILVTVHDGDPQRADRLLQRYGPARVG